MATPPPAARRPGRIVAILAAAALAAWAVRSFVAAPFSIPSPSMLPAMLPGDYLFAAKWPYGYSRFAFPGDLPAFAGRIAPQIPKRGEIVVFRHPSGRGDWVKRVVGLPGDTVSLSGGRVILNRRPLPRVAAGTIRLPISPNMPCPPGRAIDGGAFCGYRAFSETIGGGTAYMTIDQQDGAPGDDFAPLTVPPGHLFLLGDNRDDSADSRFSLAAGGTGLVPTDRLVGRAGLIFWSSDGSATTADPASWFAALRADRLGRSYSR